ncbi:ATP-binding protein [Streptomyces sp. VNUA24]|uniref:ATP-binding protein n=1 Tax=Streptomyces sp. VNUA24 TaxID=3031131 RepID=UPI0023B87F86|nr:ATP-binding protein [Streptomyces sp. VNUA24]WEH16934.1 ATP-binding protein [Streptomyces sp. VNUA24]
MLTKWCRAFPGLPEEVPQARRFVAALLDERGPVDDAVLIVSELATNAVRHSSSGLADGWFLVIVSFGHDLVRIEVVDTGSEGEPCLRDATEQEEGGRGLALIAACAKDWGVKNWPDGRSVWAELMRERV